MVNKNCIGKITQYGKLRSCKKMLTPQREKTKYIVLELRTFALKSRVSTNVLILS